MNIQPQKFALFGNTYQAKKSAHVLRLLSILEKHQAEIYIHKEFYQFLTKEQKMDIHAAGVFEGNEFDVDMVLSMGGDGTFLKAASYVGNKNIPILGIVENLSYIECPDCKKRINVFGESHVDEVAAKYGLRILGK